MCDIKEGFSGHVCMIIFMGNRMYTTTSTAFLQTGSLSFTFPFHSGNLGVESEGVGVVRGACTLGKAHGERRCAGGGSSLSSFS